jgi:type IV pilus assembly protein PilQ
MKYRILSLAVLALGLAAAPVQAQASACRADTARCITVTFEQTEMRDVAATFVTFSGTSIVLGEGVDGKVTADIRNQPWDVALRAILQAYGLGAREIAPGLLRVDPLERLAAQQAVEPLVTRVFRLRYVPAASVASSLSGVKSARGTIAVNEEANALVITDTPAVITAMERLIGHSGS